MNKNFALAILFAVLIACTTSPILTNEAYCDSPQKRKEIIYEGESLPKAKNLLLQINARLKQIHTITGDFVQFSSNNSQTNGVLYLAKPNKVKFEYAYPENVEIIYDGVDLVILDRTNKTREIYSASDMPIRCLLSDKPNLPNNKSITKVTASDLTVRITFNQTSILGNGLLTLVFDRKSSNLLRWIINDAQGNNTTLVMKKAKINQKIDESHFVIEQLFDLHNTR